MKPTLKIPSAGRLLRNTSFRLLLSLFLFLIPLLAGAVEVLTKDGQTFRGKIIEEATESILMEIKNGVQVRIDRSEILSIQQTRSPEFKREYPVVGLGLGSPAVLNATLGYYWKDAGFKASGAFWAAFQGIQFDLSKKIIESPTFLGNLSLVGGSIAVNGDTDRYSLWGAGPGSSWLYAGVGADVNWGGLFLEVDLVAGGFPKGTAVPYQIGYMYRFD